MNNRERVRAILHYEDYDRLPVVHFGYWDKTLLKWAEEGHVTHEEAASWADGNPTDTIIAARLGFDFDWLTCFSPHSNLFPAFEPVVVAEFEDGARHIRNGEGMTVLERPGAGSIPQEIEHLLKDRDAWELHYLPRLQFSIGRITQTHVPMDGEAIGFRQGGLERMQAGVWENPLGLHAGSLMGVIRNWFGVVGLSYIQADDPALFAEVVDTVGELCYECTKRALEMAGGAFDFGHFWEDISFKSGPLINPRVFRERVGPHYRRITELFASYGIDIVSLDSDGKVDKLIPIWLDNGVNTMFPIEVGTWGSSIGPWREQYGRALRGVGGMNKVIFSRDYATVDAEIERLRPLVDLGGYIPCPDHRLAPDAKWENVQYYCERMRRIFG